MSDPAPEPSAARRDRRTGRTFVRGAFGILLFFAVAELVTSLELVPAIYLPRASTVVVTLVHLLGEPSFLRDVGATLLAWGIAVALATVIAVPLGILLGSNESAYRIAMPLVEFMRPIPAAVLIPVAIIMLGQNLPMKIALVAYATSWPILYNTIYGVHDVDPVAVQTARVFNLPRVAILRQTILPSAAPFIFTGIRISASLGLIVVVGAELLAGATSGIGSFILNVSTTGGLMDQVLAGAAVAGLLGLAINATFTRIDQRLFAWRYLGGRAG